MLSVYLTNSFRLFVLDTPAFKGSYQTAGSVPAPRVFLRPRMVLMWPPSLREAVTGREYHYACCRLSPRREPPSGYSKLFLAPCQYRRKQSRPKEKVKSCCFPGKAHPGAAAKVAHAHHNNNRNVFDEWVCCFQDANPLIYKRQTGEGKVPSPVSSLIG